MGLLRHNWRFTSASERIHAGGIAANGSKAVTINVEISPTPADTELLIKVRVRDHNPRLDHHLADRDVDLIDQVSDFCSFAAVSVTTIELVRSSTTTEPRSEIKAPPSSEPA